MRPLKTFDPRNLGGLEVWLDAFVPPEGGVWLDKSGNGRNGIQDAVNNRPVLVASGINSRPALQFDGDNDNFAVAPLALPNWYAAAVCLPTGSNTIAYVAQVNAIPRVLSSANSGLVTASGAASGSVAPSFIDSRIGASWAGGSLKTFFNGLLGEVLIYSSTLGAGPAAAVESYLRAKWGL